MLETARDNYLARFIAGDRTPEEVRHTHTHTHTYKHTRTWCADLAHAREQVQAATADLRGLKCKERKLAVHVCVCVCVCVQVRQIAQTGPAEDTPESRRRGMHLYPAPAYRVCNTCCTGMHDYPAIADALLHRAHRHMRITDAHAMLVCHCATVTLTPYFTRDHVHPAPAAA